MTMLSEAIATGRRALLVNTVWDHNPSDYDDTLVRLDKIIVRETLSQNDLRNNHLLNSDLCLDFCYFADIDREASASDFDGSYILTDYYDDKLGDFCDVISEKYAHLPKVYMKDYGWSEFVCSLQTSSLLVTGRHHAVYGACRARVPFVAIEGNSHKIQGLVSTTGFDIPVGATVADIPELIEWAERNRDTYSRFFDWMEKFAKNVLPATLFSKI